MGENQKEEAPNDNLTDESNNHVKEEDSENANINLEDKLDSKFITEVKNDVISQESESNSQHIEHTLSSNVETTYSSNVDTSFVVSHCRTDQNRSEIESMQNILNDIDLATINNSRSNVTSDSSPATSGNHNNLTSPPSSTSNDTNNQNEVIETESEQQEQEPTITADEDRNRPVESEIVHDNDLLVVATPLASDQLIYEALQEAEIHETCCTFVVRWNKPFKEARHRILFLLVLIAIVMVVIFVSLQRKNSSANLAQNEEDTLQLIWAGFFNLIFGLFNSNGFDLFETLTVTTEPSAVTSNSFQSGDSSITTPTPTPPPTVSQAPSSELLFQRNRNITNIIQSISPIDSFENPFSSQSRALNWIIYEDNLQVNSSYSTLVERYALKVLFYDLNGESWINKTGYITESINTVPLHECEWYGVVCEDDLRVPKALRFQANGLTGKISEEISLLTNLTTIQMFQNSINGTLPESLYSLTQLVSLQLHGNILQGTLSTGIGKLKELTTLTVRSNLLTGTIPTELGSLSKLISCRLYSNLFTGSFPDFLANNSNLRILNFGDNKLEGTVSPSFGNLTKLVNLYFYDNNFVGTIPSEWGGLTSLKNTGFWTNKLSGTLPNEFLELPNLKDLSVGRNNFTGSFPISKKLEELWVYDNSFNGSLPTEIGTMTSLKVLQAWSNEFSGQIPSQIGNLESIVTLQFAKNHFSGTIPETVVDLKRMIVINLSQNNLTGLIPSNLTNLPVLNSVDLHSNNFSGTMPINFCDKFMNRLTSDCENLNCTCCTCCYGEGNQPIYGEC